MATNTTNAQFSGTNYGSQFGQCIVYGILAEPCASSDIPTCTYSLNRDHERASDGRSVAVAAELCAETGRRLEGSSIRHRRAVQTVSAVSGLVEWQDQSSVVSWDP